MEKRNERRSRNFGKNKIGAGGRKRRKHGVDNKGILYSAVLASLLI